MWGAARAALAGRSLAALAPRMAPPVAQAARRSLHSSRGACEKVAAEAAAEAAPAAAAGGKTSTEALKQGKQRTKMVMGSIAVAGLGYAAYMHEELLEWKNDMWKMYSTPVVENLLPPPLPDQPAMKTLVLDLEETLVHFEYDRTHGWRCLKRPYIDTFLDYLALGGLYEVVVFSNGFSYSVEPFLDKIDPMVLTSRGIQMRFQVRPTPKSTLSHLPPFFLSSGCCCCCCCCCHSACGALRSLI